MSIEAMKLAMEALELAKRSHGKLLLSDPPQEAWKTYRVDDSITKAVAALRQAINAAEQREQALQADKEGSPCPEFWDWLPKAYNFEGDGNFTKYNMEVAFLAGKQSVEQAQQAEPVAWGVHDQIALEKSLANCTSPPPRQPLTDKEIADLWSAQIFHINDLKLAKDFVRDIEAAHGIKENNT